MNPAEKARLEAALYLPAEKASQLTGSDLLSSKAFREVHAAQHLSHRWHPQRTRAGTAAPTRGRLTVPPADNRNDNRILALSGLLGLT